MGLIFQLLRRTKRSQESEPHCSRITLNTQLKELIMYVTPEQITAANKSNVESVLSIAAAQFAAMEKLAGLQTAAFKSLFEDSIANARALAGAKDVQELVSLQQTFAQPAVEKAVAYSKSVYAIAVEANSELSKFAESK